MQFFQTYFITKNHSEASVLIPLKIWIRISLCVIWYYNFEVRFTWILMKLSDCVSYDWDFPLESISQVFLCERVELRFPPEKLKLKNMHCLSFCPDEMNVMFFGRLNPSSRSYQWQRKFTVVQINLNQSFLAQILLWQHEFAIALKQYYNTLSDSSLNRLSWYFNQCYGNGSGKCVSMTWVYHSLGNYWRMPCGRRWSQEQKRMKCT